MAFTVKIIIKKANPIQWGHIANVVDVILSWRSAPPTSLGSKLFTAK